MKHHKKPTNKDIALAKRPSATQNSKTIVSSVGSSSKFTILKNRKNIFIIVISLCALILLVATGAWYINRSDDKLVFPAPQLQLDDVAGSLDSLLQQKLPSDASITQKTEYYESIVSKLTALEDTRRTAEIYINQIQPQGIKLSIEASEWLVTSLIANGYKQEARAVAGELVVMLNQRMTEVPPDSQQSLSSLIQYYATLKDTL